MKTNKLYLIYRVCDKVNVCSAYNRCFNVSKNKLIKKCLCSLKSNIDNLDNNIEFHFICVYDNCSDDLIDHIKTIYNKIIFIKPKISGNAGSFCECVDIASNIEDDVIIYFLEDDYLFLSNSVLNNIVYNFNDLYLYNKKYCALMPDDYPDRYFNNKITTECCITRTGHFLKIDKTTCTFVISSNDVKRHYNDLYKFIMWPKVGEDQSVNLCWKDIPLYQPIPAYTLHSLIKSVIPIYLNFNRLKNYFES